MRIQERYSMRSFASNISKSGWFLIILGTVLWSITMVKSGWGYPYGLGFWGPNGHDGIWHISLINNLAQGSLEMPVFAGEQLKNYHIGFDLLLAVLHRLTFIPTHILYFQIVPPILALLIGVLSYKFVHLWTKSKGAAFWSTFFVYFGGSWGPIVTFLRDKNFGGESMFWAQQSISTLINPPFAASLILLLLGCIVLLRFNDKPTAKRLIVLSLIFGGLTQIKVYGGILVLGSLAWLSVYQIIKEQKAHFLKVFLGSALISTLLFLPLNQRSSTLLVWQPFWFLETMMAVSDRVSWPRFYEAMINYKAAGIWYKAIPAYFVGFVIFWVGNMGTRTVKEFLIFRWIFNFFKMTNIEMFLGGIMTTGLVLAMTFVQKGTPWNTIQFVYYSLFFSGIVAGIAFQQFIEKKAKSVRGILIVALLILTLPTTYSTLKHYVPTRPPAKVSGEEQEALKFLSKQERGTVLTYPYDSIAAERAQANPPRPLYLYESTAYVSAFSKKPVYLEDEVNLNITDYPWRERRQIMENWYATLDEQEGYSFLRDNKIRYVYWVKPQRARLGETQLGISRIFENKEVDIYQVD